MKITWIGHSCFKIESSGYTVITDPYADGYVPGLKPVRESANEVLVSHEHGDHSARNVVEMITGETSPFTVTQIQTYHDPVKGMLRGRNIIHVLEGDGYKIAHFGDLGCALTAEQAEQLKGLDVALIPVGGHYTINAKEAAVLVKEIRPKHVIPMHYRDPEREFGFGVIGTVREFTKRMGSVAFVEGSEYDPAQGPAEQVVVLVPQNN